MRKVGLVLSVLLLVALAVGPALAQQPFSDVPTDHWAYNAVNDLAEKGLLEGYPDGTFKGRQPLTRYEFAQAVARMLDRLEQMQGVAGPPGPPGPPGAGALTPEQQALLDRLAKEFAPELKALRSDLDSLTKRVEDLEAKPEPEMPKVAVGGMMSWRAGLYGTKLGTGDVETTGYPGAGILGIPITDGLKDAYKASDFMTMKTRVDFTADLAENVESKVSLLAGPETNRINSPGAYLGFGSPLAFSSGGVMDEVAVDEAWVKVRTNFIAPADIAVGKQYFSRGQGLLADNDQEAIKAFRIDWKTGAVSFGALWGMLDREQFWARSTGALGLPRMYDDGDLMPSLLTLDTETSGQDNYNLYTLNWAPGPWSVGGTWLDSGFNKESGWSVDLKGNAFGLDWYGEYAQLRKWPTGEKETESGLELSESDTAWLAGMKWQSPFVQVTGEYGRVDAGYAFAFPGGGWTSLSPFMVQEGFWNLPLSRLHPNAAVDPHDINWVDRPLFLDPTNIAKGWHANVTFPTLLGENAPLSISYMSGHGYEPDYLLWLDAGGAATQEDAPDKWRKADPVWTAKLSRQLSENVGANLVYGRRSVDRIMAAEEDTDDTKAIQVIRAEVCVAF